MGRIQERRVRLRDGRGAALRSPDPADAKALIEHVRALLVDGAGQVGLPEELDLTPDQERTWIRAHAEAPGQVAILAEVEGALAGLLNFEVGARRRIAHRGVLGMGVLGPFRGVGVGRALLEALIEWAAAEPGVEKLCLAVRADNEPAIGLYHALGFEPEGRRQREIKLGAGTYVDDILMARFVVR